MKRLTLKLQSLSHPTWVRGLKYCGAPRYRSGAVVAPHVGAWIEMIGRCVDEMVAKVAPHVGAWIEISPSGATRQGGCVAPHVGAWIEIR